MREPILLILEQAFLCSNTSGFHYIKICNSTETALLFDPPLD